MKGSLHVLSQRRSVPLLKSRSAGAYILPRTGKVSDRITAYGGGRICEVRDCDTILSTYNPAHFCSLHDRVRALQRRS